MSDEEPMYPQTQLRRAIEAAKEAGIPLEEARAILLEVYECDD